jgi:hypothetical protein
MARVFWARKQGKEGVLRESYDRTYETLALFLYIPKKSLDKGTSRRLGML